MNSLLHTLNIVEQEEDIIRRDVEYLAKCYVEENTNFELPMVDDDISIDICYNNILHRTIEKINEINPTLYIDHVTLGSIIDYYYLYVNNHHNSE